MSEDLLNKTLSPEYFWSSYSRIRQIELHNSAGLDANLYSLYTLALMIGFMLTAFQFSLTVYKAYRDGEHPFFNILPYVYRLVVVTFLIYPPVYHLFMRVVVAKPADAIADLITATYYNSFMASVQKLMSSFANSNSLPSSIFTAILDGSLVTTVFSTFTFWVASIFLFLMPLIQSCVFLYLFYVGPICLIFALCDYTSNVAKAWLGLTFAVAWSGFFGSLTFFAGQALGLFSALGSGSASSDAIIVFVYGILSIIIFAMAFPLAAFFFEASSPIGKLLNPGKAVSSSAAKVSDATRLR